MRFNYYPKQKKAIEISKQDGKKLRCEPHVDSGIMTILYQDKNGGLQLQKKENDKLKFLLDYLTIQNKTIPQNNTTLVDYFNKYQAFCFDLCLDSVLKGDLNFTYK